MERRTITIILRTTGINHEVIGNALGFQRYRKSEVTLTFCPTTFLIQVKPSYGEYQGRGEGVSAVKDSVLGGMG